MTAIDQLNATPGERQVAAMAKALAKHEPDVCGTDSYEAVEVSGLSTGVAPAPMAITLRLGRDEFTEFAKQPAQRIIWRAVLHRTRTPRATWVGEESIRRIWHDHVNHLGWRHIGYHFIIDPEGGIWTGRPLAWTGAHAGPEGNVGSIGVAVYGATDNEPATSAALSSAMFLWAELANRFGYAAEVNLHSALEDVACPGRFVTIADLAQRMAAERSPEQMLGVRSGDRELTVSVGGVGVDAKGYLAGGVAWVPFAAVSRLLGLTVKDLSGTGCNAEVALRSTLDAMSLPPVPDPETRRAYVLNSLIRCAVVDGVTYVPGTALAVAAGVNAPVFGDDDSYCYPL